MALKTYNLKEVSVLAGLAALSGFAEGDAVTITFDEDAFTTQIGADGEQTRSRTNNKKATVVINLQQASDSNDVLSGLHINDVNTGNGIFPMTIKDKKGRTLFFGPQAYIRKFADSAFGRDSGSRSWTIDVPLAEIFIGGN